MAAQLIDLTSDFFAFAAEYSLAALARWSPERIQEAMAWLLDQELAAATE